MSTPTENTMWRVFSVYEIETESYYLTTYFSSNEVFTSFLDTLKSRSIHNFNTSVTNQDKIITLSTCSKTKNKRIVLHAKLATRETR